jgi:hypothetical protein
MHETIMFMGVIGEEVSARAGLENEVHLILYIPDIQ